MYMFYAFLVHPWQERERASDGLYSPGPYLELLDNYLSGGVKNHVIFMQNLNEKGGYSVTQLDVKVKRAKMYYTYINTRIEYTYICMYTEDDNDSNIYIRRRRFCDCSFTVTVIYIVQEMKQNETQIFNCDIYSYEIVISTCINMFQFM